MLPSSFVEKVRLPRLLLTPAAKSILTESPLLSLAIPVMVTDTASTSVILRAKSPSPAEMSVALTIAVPVASRLVRLVVILPVPRTSA